MSDQIKTLARALGEHLGSIGSAFSTAVETARVWSDDKEDMVDADHLSMRFDGEINLDALAQVAMRAAIRSHAAGHTADLSNCPFCGSRSARLESAAWACGLAYVACNDCGTEGPCCATDEQAVAAWNRRTEAACDRSSAAG